MKGITLSGNHSVKDITEFLSKFDPDAAVRISGTVSMAAVETPNGQALAVFNGCVVGMITDDNPYGIEFVRGENEHPMFKGMLIAGNDETDMVLMVLDAASATANAIDVEYSIDVVSIPDTWDTYNDIVYLLYAGDAGHRTLIGYIIDEDDAEETFVKGPGTTMFNCFGLINQVLFGTDALPRITLLETKSYEEFISTAYCYSCVDDTDSHMYLNPRGIGEVSNFVSYVESVTVTDEDGDDFIIPIGIVADNTGVVRLVYVSEVEYLEQAIDNSMALSIASDGKYTFNTQRVLSEKCKVATSMEDPKRALMPAEFYAHLLDGYYDRSTFVGAVTEMIELIYNLDEDDLDDEDEDDDCPYPERQCSECDLLGSNECPNCAEDPDDE